MTSVGDLGRTAAQGVKQSPSTLHTTCYREREFVATRSDTISSKMPPVAPFSDVNHVHKWLKERERKKAERSASKDPSGAPLMTPEAIRAAALEDDGYETAELNDRLYLHFKGYRRIQNLEPYTGVKALWLGSNGLERIEGIGHMSQLRCLYLQQNLIRTISGLEGLDNLVQIDLSHNSLEHITGLSHLPALHTLNISKNAIAEPSGLRHLWECPALTNLDISANRLSNGDDDGGCIVQLFAAMPCLVALTIAGNPFVSGTPCLRKTLITSLPALQYLDRPIFEVERIAAHAWSNGGKDAEVRARTAYQSAQLQRDRDQMQEFRDWQAERRNLHTESVTRRLAMGLPARSPPSNEELEAAEARFLAAKQDATSEKMLIREVGVHKMGAHFWASKPGECGAERDLHRIADAELQRLSDEARCHDSPPCSSGPSSSPVKCLRFAGDVTENEEERGCGDENIFCKLSPLELQNIQFAEQVQHEEVPVKSSRLACCWSAQMIAELRCAAIQREFDFEAIADDLRRTFPTVETSISSSSCKAQWLALDENESESESYESYGNNGADLCDSLHPIVPPISQAPAADIIQQGNVSFDELMRAAATTQSRCLVKPMHLPCVNDITDSDDGPVTVMKTGDMMAQLRKDALSGQ